MDRIIELTMVLVVVASAYIATDIIKTTHVVTSAMITQSQVVAAK